MRRTARSGKMTWEIKAEDAWIHWYNQHSETVSAFGAGKKYKLSESWIFPGQGWNGHYVLLSTKAW